VLLHFNIYNGTSIHKINTGSAFWKFKKILPPMDRFYADPFVVSYNEKYYMFIEEYVNGNIYNHKPKSERRLLLNKRELKKLQKELQNVGLTIIPLKLFLTDKGWAKLQIALCKGKKLYDKRETIKDRDNKRSLDRIKKDFK